MSHINVIKKNNKSTSCKVCRDAGKKEKEYNSHNVKNSVGVTICPILLNNKCRFCHKKGHTLKYCDSLLNQKIYKTAKVANSEKVINVGKVKNVENIADIPNIYSILELEDEIISQPLTHCEKVEANIHCEAVEVIPILKLIHSSSSKTIKIIPKCQKRWCDYSSDDEDYDY